MALVKVVYSDGETIIGAENLNDIQDEVISLANNKQDTIIAGDNITIGADGRTISATGGGGGGNVDDVIVNGSSVVDSDKVARITMPTVAEVNEIAGALQDESEARILADSALGTRIDNIDIPTALADLTDDATHRLVTDTEKSDWNAKYDKPSGGIPKTDLASAVQTSLGLADSALQSVPSTYRTSSAQDIIDAGKVDTTDFEQFQQSVESSLADKVDISAQSAKTASQNSPVGIDANGKLWYDASGGQGGGGDMLKSVYDADEAVANAGGIANYVEGHGGAVASVNGQTGAVELDAEDVGALPDSTVIPTALSDLTSDATHRVVTDTEKSTWNAKGDMQASVYDPDNGAKQVAFKDSVTTIEAKIPAQATSSNQLADKNFVNSSIENVAAYYITKDAAGNPFSTKAELNAATTFYSGGVARVPTRNDYCVVLADESKTITETGENPTTRYIYDNNTWSYKYIVNNSGLTAVQWATVNSGLTADMLPNGVSSTNKLVKSGDLATVATSGSYDDLSNKPTVPTVATYTATLNTTWSGSAAPYSKAQTISGILASDTPIIDIVPSSTYATAQSQEEGWSNIYRAVCSANTITFYAHEKPTVSLPIKVTCVR